MIRISGLLAGLIAMNVLAGANAGEQTSLDNSMEKLSSLITEREPFNKLEKHPDERCTVYYTAYPVPRISDDLYFVAKFSLRDIGEWFLSKADFTSLYLYTYDKKNRILTEQFRRSSDSSTNQSYYTDTLHLQFKDKKARQEAVGALRTIKSYCPSPPPPKPKVEGDDS